MNRATRAWKLSSVCYVFEEFVCCFFAETEKRYYNFDTSFVEWKKIIKKWNDMLWFDSRFDFNENNNVLRRYRLLRETRLLDRDLVLLTWLIKHIMYRGKSIKFIKYTRCLLSVRLLVQQVHFLNLHNSSAVH